MRALRGLPILVAMIFALFVGMSVGSPGHADEKGASHGKGVGHGNSDDGNGKGGGDDDEDGSPDGAFCGDHPDDAAATAAARAAVSDLCHCEGARNHGQYVRCVAHATKAMVRDGSLRGICRGQVISCAAHSACGKRHRRVACCRTDASGASECSLERRAERCTAPPGGTACVSSSSSCCDACLPGGECAIGTTTSTIPGGTTSTTIVGGTTTTTSTTIAGSTTSTTIAGTTTSTTLAGSTTTSTTIGGTTTSTTMPTGACCGATTPTKLSFTTGIGSGNCGTVLNTDGSTFKTLACGGLYFGGGANSVPLPASVPDMETSITKVAACANNTLTLVGAAEGELGATHATCTKTGCLFGPPLPIPNTASTPTSTCVINSVAADANGTGDCTSGSSSVNLPLSSEIFLAGDINTGKAGIQPCPTCENGLCSGGPNNGNQCTPGNSASLGAAYPTSNDCPPDPLQDIGSLPIGFVLSTGTVTSTAVPSGTQTRVFCGFCRDADGTGAFKQPAVKCLENGAPGGACDATFESCEQNFQGAFGPAGGTAKTITLTGAASGDLSDHAPHASTLVSVFCIPPTFNDTVDAAANLPGPGAVSLPGQAQLE